MDREMIIMAVDVMCRKFKHSTVIELVRFVFNTMRCDLMTLWHRCQIMHTFMSYVRKRNDSECTPSPAAIKKKHNRNVKIYLQRCKTNISNNWICFERQKTMKPKIMHWNGENVQCQPAARWMMQKYFEWSTMMMTTATMAATQP